MEEGSDDRRSRIEDDHRRCIKDDRVYIRKEFMIRSTDLPCLHCGGPILFRPVVYGTSGDRSSGGIRICGYFCSWPCARAYACHGVLTDYAEELMTSILRDFRDHLDNGDDEDGHRFLQSFHRFSQIPTAPPREKFVPFGSLTYEEYRRMWVQFSKIEETKRHTNRWMMCRGGRCLSTGMGDSRYVDESIVRNSPKYVANSSNPDNSECSSLYTAPHMQMLSKSPDAECNPPSTWHHNSQHMLIISDHIFMGEHSFPIRKRKVAPSSLPLTWGDMVSSSNMLISPHLTSVGGRYGKK